MNLAELGSYVREKRESKNLSIADVSKAIKIPQQSLIAIEEGNLAVIGYETYYKSFLKCYLLHLGGSFAEYQELVKNVDEFSEEAVVEKTLKPQYGEPEEEKAKPRSKKLTIQLLILAILGGSAYFYFSQSDMFSKDKAEAPVIEEKAEPALIAQKEPYEEAASQAVTEQNNASLAEQKESTEAALKEANNADEREANSAAKENNKEVNAAAQNTSELVLKKTEEQEQKKEEVQAVDLESFLKENPAAQVIDWNTVAAPQKGEQQAVMHAKQDCWMQYTQDGKSGHFILRKGEQRVFNFKENLYFKIANGSAITLFHNKKPVAVGDSSKVREVNLK